MTTGQEISAKLLGALVCPRDRARLRASHGWLECERGHRFPEEQGIPVFADQVRREPVPANMEPCRHTGSALVDAFVSDWIVNTNGNLYRRVRGKLPRHPIPEWPLDQSHQGLLVDLGCGWGRWSIAAARAGLSPIGVDVHIDALAAAARVARQFRVEAAFACADAECLPLASASVDVVFSYSVLQHLEKEKAARVIHEAARVLRPGGICLVQLPNANGLYNLTRQAGRGFRAARPGTFEMRYWSSSEVCRTLESAGLTGVTMRADGFFTQNPQLSDLDLLSLGGKTVVLASHLLCRASRALALLGHVADSIWVQAEKPR
jgi:2-polyprenyl-3-methyl-5-hydroxy-6-metoxy-1,4-benzoquinol methylase